MVRSGLRSARRTKFRRCANSLLAPRFARMTFPLNWNRVSSKAQRSRTARETWNSNKAFPFLLHYTNPGAVEEVASIRGGIFERGEKIDPWARPKVVSA